MTSCTLCDIILIWISQRYKYQNTGQLKNIKTFSKKIKIEGEFDCVVWQGARSNGPTGERKYALFTIKGKLLVLHRHLWKELRGPLKDWELLDHFKCQNKGCINLDHLEPVTARENVVVRGTGITAQNILKSVCPKGHPYSGINSQGKRICKKCGNENLRRSRANARRNNELVKKLQQK